MSDNKFVILKSEDIGDLELAVTTFLNRGYNLVQFTVVMRGSGPFYMQTMCLYDMTPQEFTP